MKKIFVLALAAFALASCGGNATQESENAYKNDFEIGHWGDYARVVKGQAHSGSFTTVTDSANEFSLTFQINKADLKNKAPKAIHVKAWVYCTSLDTKSQLVTSIESDGKAVGWQGTELHTAVKAANTWTEVEVTLPIAATLADNSVIKAYGWRNNGTDKVLWDDFTITIE